MSFYFYSRYDKIFYNFEDFWTQGLIMGVLLVIIFFHAIPLLTRFFSLDSPGSPFPFYYNSQKAPWLFYPSLLLQ